MINSKGEISPRPGANEPRLLLEAESAEFDTRGRAYLPRFGWESGSGAGPLNLF